MNDVDLELRLRRWLVADASAPPASLRSRVLDIPRASSHRSAWWHRFASVPVLTGTVAVVTAIAMLLSGSFFTLFDRPPGADGGLCNNRQLQRALDALRDTDGYRYRDTEQHQVLLSDPETALDDPVFGWADTLVSDVSYLAPDRTREVVTHLDPEAGRGFLEQVRIGNEQWQLREVEGEPTWVRDAPWPFGNWAWGYVQNTMGILGLPMIASIRFGSEPVPDGLSGEGGCTIAAPGEVETRIVALRVGDDGRVSDIYLGPPADAPGNRDAYRNLIELEYTLPAADEFVAPSDFVEGDVLSPTYTTGPQPTPVALVPPDGAWDAIPFPLPDDALVGAYVGPILEADGRWIAIGSGQFGDAAFESFVWTSSDGITWQLAGSPTGFTGMSLADLAWDGRTYLAIGYRTQEQRDDGTADPDRPESWLSTDGVTWEPGGLFDVGANPSRPVPTEHGWVAGGSIWSGMTQRPAFFSSPDGRTWTTHRPEAVAFGYVSQPVVEPDGTLSATSCETPEETNMAGGSPCFVREWTSTDGVTWTPGSVSEDAGTDLQPVPAGDGLLAIRSDTETGELELVRSDDGTSWEPVPLPAASIWPNQLIEIPDGVVLVGQESDAVASTIMHVWRSRDGGVSWEEIPLGVMPGAIGVAADRALVTDEGLAIYGWLEIEEGQARPVVWVEP